MPKRGQFGCQNCEACGRAAVAAAGRSAGRALADMSTLGMWRVGRGFQKKCGVCGHLMKMHQVNPVAVVGASPPTQWPQAQVPPIPMQQAPMPQTPMPQPSGRHAIGVGGQVEVSSNSVIIQRKGTAARLGKLVGGGEDKTIPIASIAAVDIKEAVGGNGYITFSEVDGNGPPPRIQDAYKDENTVVFTQTRLPEFVAVRDLVERRILESDGATETLAAVPETSAQTSELPPAHANNVVDQLERLAALREKGILSEEQFSTQRDKLLSEP